MNNYLIREMQESDIPQAIKIWVEQNKLYCSDNMAFPGYWRDNTNGIAGYLNRRVQSGTAVVIELDNRVIGYQGYEEFPFNGEESAFCPVVLHAVVEEYKEEAYTLLYKYVSQRWVLKNILNHMWIINFNDLKLRNILYDLGFGSYLIDAFACTAGHTLHCNESYVVKRAGEKDKGDLYDLIEESREYYSSAPLFLRRDQYSMEEVESFIKGGNLFIAWDKEMAIGFINVSVSQDKNIIEMWTENCGLIDEIGAYIKPQYRGKGIGKELLKNVFDFCKSNSIQSIHVDYETANIFANKFWKKYFRPMLLSVRRTINKNIND
ncbi:MAG TPA: GNAT family N-acetyltransferase [Bacillota bacterium]|nr:GNAT family N-acetyltransferase [Bacillota bacterium]HOR87209.1 GNAT family N-acetyltransferase [Bacillota bacterium]